MKLKSTFLSFLQLNRMFYDYYLNDIYISFYIKVEKSIINKKEIEISTKIWKLILHINFFIICLTITSNSPM